MFLRAFALVAFATVVSAGVGGKSTVKAVAKATVGPDDDGEGFLISLDGSESERECANARWEVKVAGEFVKVTERMYAYYDVSEKARTYRFRLTIWDPETPERISYDFVDVEINGGKKPIGKPTPPAGDLKADADIYKVEETDDGHLVYLTGKDSDNCEDYIWEYKTNDGFVAIATKVGTKYEVLKAGKHTFRLICANDDLNKKDTDVTFVKISKCKAPKYPKGGKKNCKKNSNKKYCDPCKNVNVHAKADVVDVTRTKIDFTIYLTANASTDCMTYQWQRVRDNIPNEILGTKINQQYTVTKKGMYTFKVTCENTDCSDSDSDVVDTDCVATYNPNPCKTVNPVAKATVKGVKKVNDEWVISLSAEGSEKCGSYEWELVKAKGNEVIGEGYTLNYKTSKFGKYSFRVTCLHKKCNKEDVDFTKSKIENPCNDIEPVAAAAVTGTEKVNGEWVISLSAEGSKKCKSYSWTLVGANDNKKVGEGESVTYKTEKPGSYKFKVSCQNTNCGKSDAAYTETKIENPCKDVEPVAEAVVTSVKKVNGERVISLSAEGSKKCSSYEWNLIGGGKIGEDASITYTTSKFGSFKFRVTCLNKKCDKSNADVTETFIKNPCNNVKPDAVAEVMGVKNVPDGWVIFLSAAKSEHCDSYQWFRTNFDGSKTYETLGNGAEEEYKVTKAGRYAFRVKCTNKKCDSTDSDLVQTECVRTYNPCKNVNSVAKAAVIETTKEGGEWVISLSSAGSEDCESYQWELVQEGGNVNIGKGKKATYTTSNYGTFNFKLTCSHSKCKDSATAFTSKVITNPCNVIDPVAAASSSYTDVGVEKYLIKLSAANSKQCDSYLWELVKPDGNENIGKGKTNEYKLFTNGVYKFKLTCKSKCDKSDVDFTQVFIVNNNPCKHVNPVAVAKVTNVKKSGSNWVISLSAAGSTECQSYSWKLVKSGTYENIGSGLTQTYTASSFGFYKFIVKCENIQCKKSDTEVTETSIPDPCKDIQATANAVVQGVQKISGSEWEITLSAANSEDCQSYSWRRSLGNNKYETLGNAVTQTYTAKNKGSYIFELKCENTKCPSTDTDIAQTKCVNTY